MSLYDIWNVIFVLALIILVKIHKIPMSLIDYTVRYIHSLKSGSLLYMLYRPDILWTRQHRWNKHMWVIFLVDWNTLYKCLFWVMHVHIWKIQIKLLLNTSIKGKLELRLMSDSLLVNACQSMISSLIKCSRCFLEQDTLQTLLIGSRKGFERDVHKLLVPQSN